MSRVGSIVCAVALAVPLLLAGCDSQAATPGGRIFAQGQGHDGAIPRSTAGGPFVTDGMACANCHGNDGKGTPIAPDISRTALGMRHTITHKPMPGSPPPQPVTEGPWTTQQTVDVVRTGVTPEGGRLGGRMPRWQLDSRDASVLAGFLGTLR